MLDFKELSEDGISLELLARELLFNMGLDVYWSGKGPDGGRDIICHELNNSVIMSDKKIWLVQCKHKAHSGSSVGIGELDDIVDSCNQHNATGYLLICTTQPSSAVINRLEGISNNSANNIKATYWDAIKIERLLTNPRQWRIAQTFFPISANSNGWQIYATEQPNQWVVIFRGYYFHLSNRIGSKADLHLNSISDRIDELENIKFPEKHFIRVRAVHFDDKNGCYTWYLDYMHPHDQQAVYSVPQLKRYLGDECVLDDGQSYFFDILIRQYLEYSDHYDPDHYDYYQPFFNKYLSGLERERDWNTIKSDIKANEEIVSQDNNEINSCFDKLCNVIAKLPKVKLIRAVNSCIENLDKFCFLRNWSDLIKDLEIEGDRFFSSWFLIKSESEDSFIEIINTIPQGIEASFRAAKSFIVTPDGYDNTEDNLYELTISIHPGLISNHFVGRKLMNEYFVRITECIQTYIDNIR